jgi:hypothetical protein
MGNNYEYWGKVTDSEQSLLYSYAVSLERTPRKHLSSPLSNIKTEIITEHAPMYLFSYFSPPPVISQFDVWMHQNNSKNTNKGWSTSLYQANC